MDMPPVGVTFTSPAHADRKSAASIKEKSLIEILIIFMKPILGTCYLFQVLDQRFQQNVGTLAVPATPELAPAA